MIVAIVKGEKRGMRQSQNEGNVKEYSAASVAVTQKNAKGNDPSGCHHLSVCPKWVFSEWMRWLKPSWVIPCNICFTALSSKMTFNVGKKRGINKKRSYFCWIRATFWTIWQYTLIQFQIRSTELFISGWFGQFLSITKCPVGQCRLAFVFCMNTIRYFCPLFCPRGIFTAL